MYYGLWHQAACKDADDAFRAASNAVESIELALQHMRDHQLDRTLHYKEMERQAEWLTLIAARLEKTTDMLAALAGD